MRAFLLALFLLAPQAAAASTQTVKASWEPGYLDARYRGYDCVHAQNAIEDILRLIDGRRVETKCYWRSGLVSSWEVLTPVKKDLKKKKIGDFLSRQSDSPWLAGVKADIDTFSEEATVLDARWQSATLSRWTQDALACNIYADTLDRLLDELPIKRGNYTIFCNQGSGHISVNLEYLRPAKTGNKPARKRSFAAR